HATPPDFYANRLSLVDRGFAYAIAHIRGGDDLGYQWYLDGKLMKRTNTFNDFVDAARGLIERCYTAKGRITASGGRAGGELMGAVVNLRPDLFNVVIADVPFVDVLNTMLDESLPLTTQEYEQWGNPHEKEAYDYIKSYSPYDNLQPAVYPNILATAGLNDSQVSYHEPAKWVARLRTLKTGNNIVLLKTNMESGHGGATGRYDYLKELAFRYAFLIGRNGK
ncbi:MAG TPA: prolyl oligopeptidase family serine peptidase, partial [Prolixibacteraceae bacterium]|nr:prolyl oligopeptidase family serine peptidase [Prolixibacteraceae bacterium]